MEYSQSMNYVGVQKKLECLNSGLSASEPSINRTRSRTSHWAYYRSVSPDVLPCMSRRLYPSPAISETSLELMERLNNSPTSEVSLAEIERLNPTISNSIFGRKESTTRRGMLRPCMLCKKSEIKVADESNNEPERKVNFHKDSDRSSGSFRIPRIAFATMALTVLLFGSIIAIAIITYFDHHLQHYGLKQAVVGLTILIICCAILLYGTMRASCRRSASPV